MPQEYKHRKRDWEGMNYGNCFQKEERQAANRTATQGDPRIVADGDIFDYYPNRHLSRQQKLYNQPDYDPVGDFEAKFGSPQTP